MRILAIETSSPRGTVALCEETSLVVSEEHREPSAHAERMLPLIGRALDRAGWSRSSIDRIAVGTGPGSFVGLRVGIALAEGLSLGLGRPVVGVESLSAMLWALARVHSGPRAVLLDARRGEVFCRAESADGQTLLEACAVPVNEIAARLEALGANFGLAGEVVPSLNLGGRWFSGESLDLPHAEAIAMMARTTDAGALPLVPHYVRGPGAVRPNLPPSPLTPR